MQVVTIPPVDGTSVKRSNSSNKGAIAGGVVGGIVGLAILGSGVFCIMRRRRLQQARIIYDSRVEPNPELSNSAPTTTDHKYKHISMSKVGPGATSTGLALGGALGSGHGIPPSRSHVEPSASEALIERHSITRSELRDEVDVLRRDVERMRGERATFNAHDTFGDNDLPPPAYSDPVDRTTSENSV